MSTGGAANEMEGKMLQIKQTPLSDNGMTPGLYTEYIYMLDFFHLPPATTQIKQLHVNSSRLDFSWTGRLPRPPTRIRILGF